MSGAAEKERNRAWSRYLVLAGLLMLGGLGWHFGFGRLMALIGGARPGPLLGMTALIVAGFWIRAWKWHYALGPGQQGILLFFLAKTAGNWTPGRAGELAPLLLRRHRNARVAAWIGLDRVVEVAWTLGLGVAGAVAVGLLSPVAAGAMALAGLGAGAGVWLGLRRGERAPTPAGLGETPPPADAGAANSRLSEWRIRSVRFLGQLRVELMLFGAKLPVVLTATALAKVTDVYAVVLLCVAFGYPVSFLLVCAARCAHGLVSAIPITPDVTGVPFVAAALLLHEYGGIPGETLTAALGLEVVVINAILWVCFCLVSGLRWAKSS